MTTKMTNAGSVLLLLLIIVSALYLPVGAQTDAPYPVYVYQVIGGQADNASKQKFRLGDHQRIDLPKRNSAAQLWINVSPGYKVSLSKENADASVSAGVFEEGKYRIQTQNVTAAGISVKKIYYDDKVTLFSEKSKTGMAADFGTGKYSAKKGALWTVGGDNAVSSVYVPDGYWARFCDLETNGGGSGKCETFKDQGGNLKYDDQASFVEIGKGTAPPAPRSPELPASNLKNKIRVKNISFVPSIVPSTDEIPTAAELQILLQKTIQSLADALESGDFAAFQSNTATDSVLHSVSPQRLKEVYGNQKDNVAAMRLTAGKKAVFSRTPFLSEYTARTQGSSDVRTYSSLNLIGSYDEQSAGSGQMFKFNIQYLGEKGEWKLLIFNQLQTTTDLSKPVKTAGNTPPFNYPLPENPVDLLNLKGIYEKFADLLRADLENLANDSNQKRASAWEIEKGLAQLDLQSGDFKSARLHVTKWQDLEKDVQPGSHRENADLLEVIINTLEKSKNTTGQSYTKNFPAELKRVHQKLSYLNQCGLIGKVSDFGLFDKDHIDFKKGLEYSINERPGSIGNPANLQTALDILDIRLAALYILPLNPVISDLIK